jgi:VanZ family protein
VILRISLVILAGSIAYLSLSPAPAISAGNDKIGHLIAYAVLMLNIGTITKYGSKQFFIGVATALLYGVIMEFGQYYVPNRTFSVADMFANGAGVAIGASLSRSLSHRIRNFLRKARII